jgi:NTE family protein
MAQGTTSTTAAVRREPLLVDLALQGGGAHGAFTWGVIDRLLEEPWLEFDGISGTSAGAMNAAVMADGFAASGREGARVALEAFWRRVARAATFSPFRRTPLDMALGRWSLDNSPAFVMLDLLARVFSPYELAPWAPNPLEAVLAESVDFGRLARAPIKLFITATNVRTGRGRVFRNPTITPLVRECRSQDTIIVPINPVERPGRPRSARQILNRLNEVSFNAVLLKELRMIALLRQIADPGNTEGARWAGMRVHYVRNTLMVELGWSSKLNAEWEFLAMLRDEGRRAAEVFLAEQGDGLRHRSSMDLDILSGEV